MEAYTPVFENPYPDPAWSDVTDFKYVAPLIVRREATALKLPGQRRDPDYVVARPYSVEIEIDGSRRYEITVPKGMLTDLASVPRFARWIVGRVGRHLEASIVHDFLYIAWQDVEGHDARKRDWRFADAVLRAGMKAAKVNPIRGALVNLAVWTIGWFVYKERDEPRYVDLPDGENGNSN